jgi:hypothetical protein
MTVPAINPKACDMVLMTERHLLPSGNALPRRVRRSIDCINNSPKSEKPWNYPDHHRSREAIAAFAKNLSHVPRPPYIKRLYLLLLRERTEGNRDIFAQQDKP